MDAIAPEVQHRFRKVGREHAFEALKDGVHASLYNACLLTLLPFQGVLYRLISTQGDALGYVLAGLSARSLNAC